MGGTELQTGSVPHPPPPHNSLNRNQNRAAEAWPRLGVRVSVLIASRPPECLFILVYLNIHRPWLHTQTYANARPITGLSLSLASNY